MALYSLLKVNLRFGRICLVHLQGRRIYQIRNQHEAENKQYFEFQRSTRCYIPEIGHFHNHRCENLKTYTYKAFPLPTAVYFVDNYIWIGSILITLLRLGRWWYYPQKFVWVPIPDSGQNFVLIFSFPSLLAVCLAHFTFPDLTTQITFAVEPTYSCLHLFIMSLSTSFCFFLSLLLKYSSQRFVLKHRETKVFLLERTSSRTCRRYH
jgi:hypothetical protein